jgi:hypothetical protein
VKKITVSNNKKHIGIVCVKDNNWLMAVLPNKEYIICLIKLFCLKEIDHCEHK